MGERRVYEKKGTRAFVTTLGLINPFRRQYMKDSKNLFWTIKDEAE
jgi:hypothetical protein